MVSCILQILPERLSVKKLADGSIHGPNPLGVKPTAALHQPAGRMLDLRLGNGELVAISYSGDRLGTRSVNGTLYSGPVLAGDCLLVGVT